MKILVLATFVCLASAQGHWKLVDFETRNVQCVTQHPQDTSIMLVSTADSIYRSSDGGDSWTFVAHFWGLPVNCLTLWFGDTSYALVGRGSYSDGIYRSTDSGLTWNVRGWFLIPLSMCIPSYPSPFMLVGCESLGVFMSEDNCTSWELWNEGLDDLHIYALDYCMPFDSFPVFFAGTAQGLFYREWDEWTQASGIPTNVRVSSISHHKIGELGFATVTGDSWSDGIYRSTDFGQNWQVVDWWVYPSCVVMNPQWWALEDTLSIFAGDSGLGIKRSTDCGATWYEVNTGLGNLNVNALSYHFLDTTRLFCATQGGLYRYMDETGVHERITPASGFTIEVLSTIVRAGEPILIRCCAGAVSGDVRELTIFDSVGRKIRTDKVTGNISALEPLKRSGIYFVVSSNGEEYCKRKLVVID